MLDYLLVPSIAISRDVEMSLDSLQSIKGMSLDYVRTMTLELNVLVGMK